MTLILNILSESDASGIQYVSWKNNHEIERYINGNGDLDVFVEPSHRAAFMSVAITKGWVELANPVAQFPSVSHFYRAGSEGRVYHLHVYFSLGTGESWLKEYVLSLERYSPNIFHVW